MLDFALMLLLMLMCLTYLAQTSTSARAMCSSWLILLDLVNIVKELFGSTGWLHGIVRGLHKGTILADASLCIAGNFDHLCSTWVAAAVLLLSKSFLDMLKCGKSSDW